MSNTTDEKTSPEASCAPPSGSAAPCKQHHDHFHRGCQDCEREADSSGLPSTFDVWTQKQNEMFLEIEQLQSKLKTIHKDLGCELSDPNGTILEHAAGLEKKIDEFLFELEIADTDAKRCMEDAESHNDQELKNYWKNYRVCLYDIIGLARRQLQPNTEVCHGLSRPKQ